MTRKLPKPWLLLPVALIWAGSGCDDGGGSRVATLDSTSTARCNLDVPASAFHQEFEDILDTIDARYAFKEVKGVSVAQLRDTFGPEVDRATSAGAFYEVLVRLFAALHNSHSGLLLPSSANLDGGFATELVGDRLYLTGSFTDTSLTERGLARGWEVIAIDGASFSDWLSERLQSTSASTEPYARVAAAGYARRRYWFEPAVRHYRFVSPQGTSLELDLPLDRPLSSSTSTTVVTSRFVGDIGYVAVNALTGDVVQQFETELAKLVNSPALILDLRRNTGGNSPLGHPIVAHLIDRPTRVVLPNETLDPHPTLRYSGPLVVLVGPITHSAAESLAYDLYDANRATFIGMPTAGSSGNGPSSFQTTNGVVFRLPTRQEPDRSVSGALMEGVGLTPHILVDKTYEDFLASRDTVLESALSYLQGR